MRIAIINWNRRRHGGVESYLQLVVQGLHRLGQSIALWFELDGPDSRAAIEAPTGVPCWSVQQHGKKDALDSLRRWQPDLLYCHGLLSPDLEQETLTVAPGVFFAHAYYGTCISGSKTFSFPTPISCHRRFGPACFLHYYPHRCGGLNPLTMWRDYRLQARRLGLLRQYRTIVTFSQHMRAEYVRHGFRPERLSYLPDGSELEGASGLPDGETMPRHAQREDDDESQPWRLLMAGRLERLKGGHLLLAALPLVWISLGRPLAVTFAGDGPERPAWQQAAARISARYPAIKTNFPGWLAREAYQAQLAQTDLLVVPSIWPEPFGLVGLEAGSRGIPVAGFAVGGIPDWLHDGVNGHLAPGYPPTADGLAEAIRKCLADGPSYAQLRHQAVQLSRRLVPDTHLHELLGLFHRVLT